MRLPKFIYESYPVLYILGGIAGMTMVDSFVCVLSGFVLSTGGIAILFMRRNYRILKDNLTQLS